MNGSPALTVWRGAGEIDRHIAPPVAVEPHANRADGDTPLAESAASFEHGACRRRFRCHPRRAPHRQAPTARRRTVQQVEKGIADCRGTGGGAGKPPRRLKARAPSSEKGESAHGEAMARSSPVRAGRSNRKLPAPPSMRVRPPGKSRTAMLPRHPPAAPPPRHRDGANGRASRVVGAAAPRPAVRRFAALPATGSGAAGKCAQWLRAPTKSKGGARGGGGGGGGRPPRRKPRSPSNPKNRNDRLNRHLPTPSKQFLPSANQTSSKSNNFPRD